jgi:hypothetical protein
MGGVHNQTNPLICGGTDAASVARSECYSLKNNVWTQVRFDFCALRSFHEKANLEASLEVLLTKIRLGLEIFC